VDTAPSPDPARGAVDPVSAPRRAGGSGTADLLSTSRGRRRLVPTMAASLAMPVSAAVTGPIFARTIGATGRGVVTAVTAPTVLAAGVLGSGLAATVAYLGAGRPEDLAAVLRRAWLLAFVAGVAVAVALVAATPVFIRRAPGHGSAAVACAVLLPVIVVCRASRAAALSQHRVGIVNAATLVAAVVRAAAVAVLGAQGLLGVGAAVAVLIGYEVLLSLPVLLRSLGWARPKPGPRPGLTARMARYGGTATVGSLAAVVTLRLDLVVLAPLVAPRDLGLYVFAFGLSELWSGTVRAAAGVALPEVVRTGDVVAVAHLSRVLAAASVAAVAAAVVVGGPVVGVVFGPGYERTAELLPMLLAGSAVFALEGLPATLLLAAGRPGRRALGQLAGGVVTIAGLVVVAPAYGIGGAAVVSTVAYTLAAVITTAQAAAHTAVPWHRFFVLRPSDLRRRAMRSPVPGGSGTSSTGGLW